MKQTKFRAWLQNKWMDYKAELFEMDGIVATEQPEEYFRRYKWFLKSLYRYENPLTKDRS